MIKKQTFIYFSFLGVILGTSIEAVASPQAPSNPEPKLTSHQTGYDKKWLASELLIVYKDGQSKTLGMNDILKMPMYSFKTSTPWYQKSVKFTGPLLRDVLGELNNQSNFIHAVASNDYEAKIPYDDITKFNVIVAVFKDDEPILMKSKGPFFVVYPYDSNKILKSETYYSRSIWHLKSLMLKSSRP